MGLEDRVNCEQAGNLDRRNGSIRLANLVCSKKSDTSLKDAPYKLYQPGMYGLCVWEQTDYYSNVTSTGISLSRP